MNTKILYNFNRKGLLLFLIFSLLFLNIGCSSDHKANPEVENLVYEYFTAKSLLLHKKIDASQFEQRINNISLDGIPNNIKQIFLHLRPAIIKFVKLNYKTTGDFLFELGSSMVRGWMGDPTLFVDAGKQIIDGFKNDDYLKEVNQLETNFVNSLGSAGITQQWFDSMLKNVGLIN